VFDTPKKAKDSANILRKVKIECAISAAHSRLSPRQTTGYFFAALEFQAVNPVSGMTTSTP